MDSTVGIDFPKNIILQGNVLDVLKKLPDSFIDTIVTSPPYWGLRDYGLPDAIFGGTSDCNHDWQTYVKHPSGGKGSKCANVGANKNDFANMRDHDVISNTCSMAKTSKII
jgi:DNA modification methylase